MDNTPVSVKFKLKLPLLAGDYCISIGMINEGFGIGSFKEQLLYLVDVLSLKVYKNDENITFEGLINLDPDVEVDFLNG